MRILVALALLVAAACAPVARTAPTANLAPQVAPPVSAPAALKPVDEASCKTAGGDWRPICRMQKPACVISYPDAGKACTDGDDCAGNCVAKAAVAMTDGKPATGICSANNDPCGCMQLIEDGKALPMLCAD